MLLLPRLVSRLLRTMALTLAISRAITCSTAATPMAWVVTPVPASTETAPMVRMPRASVVAATMAVSSNSSAAAGEATTTRIAVSNPVALEKDVRFKEKEERRKG
jgi:hypothetical protein